MIAAPRNETELRNLLYTVQEELEHPIMIRYPRGRGVLKEWKLPFEKIAIGKAEKLKNGDQIAVLSIGNMAENASEAIQKLKNPGAVAHYDMRFVKPLDLDMLKHIFSEFDQIVTIEDGVARGGFGSLVLETASELGYSGKISILGVPDTFISQGSVSQLQEIAKIDVEAIRQKLESML